MRIMFLSQSPREPNNPEKHERIVKHLTAYTSPDTELDLCYPDDFAGARVFEAMGDKNALSGLHHTMEAPALVAKAVWAEENGYDAVVQSNTFDPGVEASRLAVRIPVIGLFRTALHTAATLAGRIGIMVPLDGHVPYTRRIVQSYGMSPFVTDVRAIGVYGKELESKRDTVRERAADVLRSLVDETDAEILIPLGGALIPYVVSPADLEAVVGAPVINTKWVGIRFAETCVRTGMRPSPLAYPNAGLQSQDFRSKAFQ